MTPSFCSLLAIYKTRQNFEGDFDALDEDTFKGILDAYEVKDALRLRDIFIKDFFFNGKTSLDKNDFEKKFKEGDFGWIFSPEGIRWSLEVNNDVKPPQEDA